MIKEITARANGKVFVPDYGWFNETSIYNPDQHADHCKYRVAINGLYARYARYSEHMAIILSAAWAWGD